MKNLNHNLLRRYIREAIDLGKVQFDPQRKDLNDLQPGREIEPNTPDEDKLYSTLLARISSGKHISPETATIIMDLLDSQYGQGPGGSGFFVEPNPGELLFRGHAVSQNWLETHVDPTDIEKILNASFTSYSPPEYDLKVPYQFELLRGWSKDLDVATNFAFEYATKGDRYAQSQGSTFADSFAKYIASGGGSNTHPRFVRRGARSATPAQRGSKIAVVLVTTPGESGTRFLDFEASMYKTKAGESFRHEKECVNLGPVTIKRARISILS